MATASGINQLIIYNNTKSQTEFWYFWPYSPYKFFYNSLLFFAAGLYRYKPEADNI